MEPFDIFRRRRRAARRRDWQLMRAAAICRIVSAGMAIGLLAACGTTHKPSRDSATSSVERGYYKVGEPYEVDGVIYTPAEDWNYDETGIASWYGPDFHGKRTANGEMYDMNQVTGAHKTLPMPCLVRV